MQKFIFGYKDSDGLQRWSITENDLSWWQPMKQDATTYSLEEILEKSRLAECLGIGETLTIKRVE